MVNEIDVINMGQRQDIKSVLLFSYLWDRIY